MIHTIPQRMSPIGKAKISAPAAAMGVMSKKSNVAGKLLGPDVDHQHKVQNVAPDRDVKHLTERQNLHSPAGIARGVPGIKHAAAFRTPMLDQVLQRVITFLAPHELIV
jgi:hypothetical protein